MKSFFQLAAMLLIVIIAFNGVVATLPRNWTHDGGELSGQGIALVIAVLFAIFAAAKLLIEDARSE